MGCCRFVNVFMDMFIIVLLILVEIIYFVGKNGDFIVYCFLRVDNIYE